MKTVYLLRHGECESNVRGEPYRGLQAKLTPKGIAEAERAGSQFRTVVFDVVVASTAPRAIETAKIVTKDHEVSISTTDLFLEHEHPTELLGTTHEEEKFKTVKQRVVEFFLRDEKYADEESFSELCERAQKFQNYLEELEGETILVVGHGKFTKFFLAYLCFGEELTPRLFLAIDQFYKSRNLGLSEIQFNEESQRWALWQWNATALA